MKGLVGWAARITPGRGSEEQRAVRELSRLLVTDPEYLLRLKQRLLEGSASPAVEVMVWHYAWGKPQEEVDLEVREVRIINEFAQQPPPESRPVMPEGVQAELEGPAGEVDEGGDGLEAEGA